MDNGYMPTWNDCYAKINELYKENLNLRESNGRLENKLSQAQNVINELERLNIAQNTIIKSLNSIVSEQREMIDFGECHTNVK
jgi:predicted nuclease with TOPRIM domain